LSALLPPFGFDILKEVIFHGIATGTVHGGISKKESEIIGVPDKPIVNNCQHESYKSLAAEVGTNAHLANPAHTVRCIMSLNTFLVNTNVGHDHPVLVPYDPAVGIGFDPIPPLLENDITRSREATR